ncbi:MAG: ABC transporter permease subunit [Longimicrobiales bacterium]|nr:ABC transporter permease subunit [Longimicrobiales bacterium]
MTWTLLRNELRMVLRDTRTVLIAVVAPLVLFPLMIFALNWVEDRETERLETQTYAFAVVGDRADFATRVVDAALALEPSETGSAVDGEAAEGAAPEGEEPPILAANFQRVSTEAPDSLLQNGELHLLVVGRDAEPGDSLASGVPVLELRFRANSDFSRNARARMQERLLAVRGEMRDSVFRSAGFPVALEEVAVLESENVASAAKEAGSMLGGALVPFLILLMLSGGSIVAADSISGEKERGTLETLLTTASSRQDIVHAKLGAIMAVGLAVGMVNIANLGVYIGLGVIDLPDNFQIAVGLDTLAILLLLVIPLIVVVAASLLLLSGIAKSYQEYQIYFLPLFLIFLLPSFAAFLPGVELNSAIAFVPISGLAVATRSLLMGDWHMIWGTVAFTSTAAAGWILLQRTEATLSNERLITSAGADEAEFRGGAAIFPREVLRWFVGFWVLFFVANLWFGEELGVRGQVLVNLGVIFLGGSVFLIHRYGLDVRETLQLHMPHWRAWPAVVIGAPSFLVLGMALFEVVNRYVFPVPDSLLEAFGQDLAGGLAAWELVFFIAVMPGVLEEIAFRGVLFSGLRKRFARPWPAVLVSALVFSVFHVSLFRIVPTAFLGLIFAMVVLRTGSILPAMLWHFLNNFLSVVPQTLGWIDTSEGFSTSWLGLAAVGAVVSWFLMTNRPGQRPPDLAGTTSTPASDGRLTERTATS